VGVAAEAIVVRELTEADAEEFLALRLRALREHPEAFGSSYEEWRDRAIAEIARRLREPLGFTLGAFDRRLVGMARCEVADVIVFLASHQARWMTGQVLYVGGGKVMPL
jgi:NAD(P)-dependent dehydrogenase (short-subunit alcohol dehydrogenase family)